MVNSFKGEVLFEDDDGKKYKFKIGMYAQSAAEDMLQGEKFPEFLARHKDWGTRDILTMFRAGLAEYHEDMTKRDVAQLMDRLGGVRCVEIFNEAINKAMPEPDPGSPVQEDAKGNARPTLAKKKSRTALATIT